MKRKRRKQKVSTKVVSNKQWIKSLIIAYIVTLVIYIFYALLLTHSNLFDVQKHTVWISLIISIIASFIAGRGAKSQEKVSYYVPVGIALGATYSIMIILTTFVFNQNHLFSKSTITFLCLCAGSGGLGGITGGKK